MPESGIYTVSRLTGEIKNLLEKRFPIIWVEGEISNFKAPGSGHFYFTLKDSNTQIQAVMFAGQARGLKFTPEDGMKITGLGRVGVYAPRGTYQIIFEHIMPRGMGELLAAFEQMKKKLADEGLFAEERKKPLPFLPAKVCIISSPTGAVVHDMIHVMTRRFPGIHIEIYPASVQGEKAADEIAAALDLANRRADALRGREVDPFVPAGDEALHPGVAAAQRVVDRQGAPADVGRAAPQRIGPGDRPRAT